MESKIIKNFQEYLLSNNFNIPIKINIQIKDNIFNISFKTTDNKNIKITKNYLLLKSLTFKYFNSFKHIKDTCNIKIHKLNILINPTLGASRVIKIVLTLPIIIGNLYLHRLNENMIVEISKYLDINYINILLKFLSVNNFNIDIIYKSLLIKNFNERDYIVISNMISSFINNTNYTWYNVYNICYKYM